MRASNRNIITGGRQSAGLLLMLIALTMTVVGMAATGAGAQESGGDEETTPVIGEEPVDADAGTGDGAAGDVEPDSDELAFTGPITLVLVPIAAALMLIGAHMTMFGVPAKLRGRHSAPNTKLRTSFIGLAASSIAGSVSNSVRQRR